jgi:hypothetical protein
MSTASDLQHAESFIAKQGSQLSLGEHGHRSTHGKWLSSGSGSAAVASFKFLVSTDEPATHIASDVGAIIREIHGAHAGATVID